MNNASGYIPSADEIVGAVQQVVDQRDELVTRLEDAEDALYLVQRQRDELRRELDEIRADMLVVQHNWELPGSRLWAFVEDAMVLAISPDLDQSSRERLVAQTKPAKLTTCGNCGAPVYEGAACGMHP